MILFLLYGMIESGFNNVFMNFTLLIVLRKWHDRAKKIQKI